VVVLVVAAAEIGGMAVVEVGMQIMKSVLMLLLPVMGMGGEVAGAKVVIEARVVAEARWVASRKLAKQQWLIQLADITDHS
jgi:hypothetical protein